MARFEIPPRSWPEVFEGYPEDIVQLTIHLRNLVMDELPTATETVGGAATMGYAQYYIDNRADVLCMISPDDDHVKLYVHFIQFDVTGRLHVEGTGQNARHVKIRPGELAPDAVRGLLEQVQRARAA